jgi:hypothetical protein
MATKNGAPLKDKNKKYMVDNKQNIITFSLNKNFRNFVLKSNGNYIDYMNSNKDILQILSKINSTENINYNIQQYKELFYYFIAISILLFFPILFF